MALFLILWFGKERAFVWGAISIVCALIGIIYGIKNKSSHTHPGFVALLVFLEFIIILMLIPQFFFNPALTLGVFGALTALIIFDGMPRKWRPQK